MNKCKKVGRVRILVVTFGILVIGAIGVKVFVALAYSTAPTIAIVTPLPVSTIKGYQTISAKATNYASVTSVKFFANGVSLRTGSGCASPTPAQPGTYTACWSTTSVTDGDYRLESKAYNGTKLIATSAVVTVKISNGTITSPTVKAKPSTTWDASVRHSNGVAGSPTPISVTVSAPSDTTHTGKVLNVEAHQGGVKRGQVFIDNQTLTGTTTHKLNLPILAAGEYEIVVMVFDAGWGTQRLNSREGTLKIAASSPTSSQPPSSSRPVTPPPSTTPISSLQLYDGPGPVDAFAGFDILKTTPQADWVGDWSGGGDIRTYAANLRVAAAGKIVPLAVYNIPMRDGGGHSSGGAESLAAYKTWIDQLALGLGDTNMLIAVEPDALGQRESLTDQQWQERLEGLRYAVQKMDALPNAKVYVDAAQWVGPAEMANRIKAVTPAGVTLNGFTLNVSAYNSTQSMVDYGNQLIAASGLPWKMLIDTSRNGVATATDWCNPRGQGLGQLPTLAPGIPNVDALLWIKGPGTSDGTCNGGPAAGLFWPEIANELIRNARL